MKVKPVDRLRAGLIILGGLSIAVSAFGQISLPPSNVLRLDDRLSVEIGDSTKPEFDPSFKLSAWGDECWLRVGLSESPIDVSDLTREVGVRDQRDSVKIVAENWEMEFFVRPDGGFEWTIILRRAPLVNSFSFPIETEGLIYYYQPPMTDEEIMEGNHRPDSVVGSYAVYHASKRDNEYRTGKAFHIYRPKAWDASGDTIWCALTVANEHITVTMDTGWLRDATYPVTIDPTFGKTDVGGSTKSVANRWRGSQFTCGSAGDADSITVYVNVSCDIGAAVYDDDSGLPGNLVDSSTVAVASGGAGWVSFTSALSPSYLASTVYHIGGVDAGADPVMAYDAGTGLGSYFADNWPPCDPANSPATSDRIYSVYVTYTAGGTAPAPSGRRRKIMMGDR